MNDWVLWQLADSAFPTGGFAHSNGLEAACQNGEVRSANDLPAWLEAGLAQLGHASLPFVTASHDGPLNFAELDQLCDCFTLNHVANRASRLQGKALWASARKVFDLPPGWKPHHANQTTAGQPHGNPCNRFSAETFQTAYYHLAPAFGAVTCALDIGREPAARLFMFLYLRGTIATAVRLGVVGPLEAQAIEYHFGARCEALLPRFLSLTIDDLAQTAPLLDTWQGMQDRLYSRLFQS
jgi:urease accessory protein